MQITAPDQYTPVQYIYPAQKINNIIPSIPELSSLTKEDYTFLRETLYSKGIVKIVKLNDDTIEQIKTLPNLGENILYERLHN